MVIFTKKPFFWGPVFFLLKWRGSKKGGVGLENMFTWGGGAGKKGSFRRIYKSFPFFFVFFFFFVPFVLVFLFFFFKKPKQKKKKRGPKNVDSLEGVNLNVF